MELAFLLSRLRHRHGEATFAMVLAARLHRPCSLKMAQKFWRRS